MSQTKRTITALQHELDRLDTNALNRNHLRPENPAYINIQAQLNSVSPHSRVSKQPHDRQTAASRLCRPWNALRNWSRTIWS